MQIEQNLEADADFCEKLDTYLVESWLYGRVSLSDAIGIVHAGLAALSARPADSDMVERVQDMLVAAYKAGATAVHNSWVEGTNGSEPDFYEAASDYARAAISAISGEGL